MSKASEWAWAAREIGEEITRLEERRGELEWRIECERGGKKGAVTAFVIDDGPAMHLGAYDATLTVEQALALAAWITDTFADPPAPETRTRPVGERAGIEFDARRAEVWRRHAEKMQQTSNAMMVWPATMQEILAALRTAREARDAAEAAAKDRLRAVMALVWAAGGQVNVPDGVLVTLHDDDELACYHDPQTRSTRYQVYAKGQRPLTPSDAER